MLAEQVEPAVALAPDLVTIYAGGNDIMRPKVDIDALVERYDAALGKLAGTGARLLVFTAFDPGGSAIYRPLRGRFALYNELVRWSADRHGATIVDFWRFRELRDWRYWDHDRLHLGPAGHQWMAIQVLDVLGVPHGVDQPDLPPEVVLTARRSLPRQRRVDPYPLRALGAATGHRPVERRLRARPSDRDSRPFD